MKERAHLVAALVALLFPLVCAADEIKVLVIPVQYSDCSFSCTEARMRSLADSAELYFNGQLTDRIVCDIATVVTLPKKYGYYGENGTSVRDFRFSEAVTYSFGKLDPGVNFATYRHFLFFSAGKSEADGFSSEHIWPQYSSLGQLALTLDGKRIDSYAVSCELGPDGLTRAGIGDFCHELGHCLGLVDLYDVQGGVGKALGGDLSLMDKGNKLDGGRTPSLLSAVDIYELEPDRIRDAGKGSYSVAPRTDGGGIFRIPSDVDGEFFLMECRKSEKWDSFISSGGLKVYHVDKSSNDAGYSSYLRKNLSALQRWAAQEVNADPAHQCACLTDVSDGFQFWSGERSSLFVDKLTVLSDGTVVFDVIEPIELKSVYALQDVAVIRWSTDAGLNALFFNVVCKDENGLERSNSVSVNASGQYSCAFENLEQGKQYRLTVTVTVEGGRTYSLSSLVCTKTQRSGSWPFIYLEDASRNDDGSFPKGEGLSLRIYNTADVSSVEWYFNGARVAVGEDGFFRPAAGGVLRAVLSKKDGSVEVIQKKIEIK